MKLALLILALLLAAPLSVAQETAPVQEARTEAADVAAADLVTTLDEAGNFTTLVQALRDTGLANDLADGESFTLFAPTDAAFEKLPAGTLDRLSPEQLVDVLRYHLIVGTVSSAEAAEQASAPTVQGDAVALTATGDALTVNGAVVTEADIEASNGVIHVIDTVLMPEADAVQEAPAPIDEQETPIDDQR